MKKIGRGWLYAVYDLGNGRVRKVVYPSWQRSLVIFFQSGHFSVPYMRKETRRIFQDAYGAYALIKSKGDIVSKMLGNPIFLNDLEYEQDKVTVFGDTFQRMDIEGKKKLIDQYIEFIHETWKYGIADKIFNFGINNGIDRQGKIVQIDFGELSLTKEEVQKEILEESWLTRGSYLRLLPLGIRSYYKTKMHQELSLENLERFWEKN